MAKLNYFHVFVNSKYLNAIWSMERRDHCKIIGYRKKVLESLKCIIAASFQIRYMVRNYIKSRSCNCTNYVLLFICNKHEFAHYT